MPRPLTNLAAKANEKESDKPVTEAGARYDERDENDPSCVKPGSKHTAHNPRDKVAYEIPAANEHFR